MGGDIIDSKVLDLDCRIGKHCLYSSIMNIFHYCGCHMKESEVFLLFDGFDIRYYVEKNHIVTTLYNEQMGRIRPAITEGAKEVSSSNRESSFAEIMRAVDSDIPVLLRIQNKYLKYDDVYKSNENMIHHILLYGYDLNNRIAYVADSYMLTGDGTVSMYCGPTFLEDIYDGITAYVIFEHLDKNILCREETGELLREKLCNFICDKNYYKGYYRGFYAVRKYIENISRLEFDEGALFESKCHSAIFDLKFGCLYHILDYLEELSCILERIDLIAPIAECRKEWGKFFVILYKLAYTSRKSKVNEAVKYGLEIYKKTCATFQNIVSLLIQQ